MIFRSPDDRFERWIGNRHVTGNLMATFHQPITFLVWPIPQTAEKDMQTNDKECPMIDFLLHRRALLGAAALLPVGPALARVARRPLRVTLLGQSLIQQNICATGWPGQAAIIARLKIADAVFTDVETAIASPVSGAATRDGEVLHAAPPVVLDCLRGLGVTLATTANNHAWDLGSDGIIGTLAELDARGIAHAGSGRDLNAASEAGWQRTPHGDVALVAAAAGAIRDGAGATSLRPGVNELRRSPSGMLDSDDVARNLDSIRSARKRGATVIACLHNHYWEPDPATTAEWQRSYARQCVDAGAAIFVAHGPPLLQGIERYKGAPLLHGLGSFIFQTRKASYSSKNWQSLIVEAQFRDGHFVDGRLTPLLLHSSRATLEAEFTQGTPSIATGVNGHEVCANVAKLSAALGMTVAIERNSIKL
jgi:poly-gamma-glutamate capsule biosynthesis protein CapA/YwtB (metallophosphatase superfamily)